jgi:protein-lysine N-methyltransferase EEF2KMT
MKPKHYIFSDSHQLVLEKIKKNINYNISNVNDVSVECLDWCQLDDINDSIKNNLNFLCIDYIVATDIIFDPRIIKPLIDCLTIIFNYNKNSDKLSFIISSTIRNDSTYNTFLTELSNICLIV